MSNLSSMNSQIFDILGFKNVYSMYFIIRFTDSKNTKLTRNEIFTKY